MILFLSFCSGVGLQIRLWCELCSWPLFLSFFSSHQNPSQCYLRLPTFLQVQWCTLNPSLRRLRQELEFGASLGYVASHFRRANKPDNSDKTHLATSLASQSESHSRKKQAYLKLFPKLFSQLSFRDLKKSKFLPKLDYILLDTKTFWEYVFEKMMQHLAMQHNFYQLLYFKSRIIKTMPKDCFV